LGETLIIWPVSIFPKEYNNCGRTHCYGKRKRVRQEK
jgi:hypothetical protein